MSKKHLVLFSLAMPAVVIAIANTPSLSSLHEGVPPRCMSQLNVSCLPTAIVENPSGVESLV